MKQLIPFFFSFLILGCGSAKVEQATTINPTNNVNGKLEVADGKRKAEVDLIETTKLRSESRTFSTEVDIRKIMTFLTSDELKGRDTGSEGIAMAADYIQNIFEENNIERFFSSYRDTLPNYEESNAYNMVGYLPGNDPELKHEFLIIGAHYDHIGILKGQSGDDTIANGANDNASGTTAILEFVRFFGNQKLNKRSIIFALFTAEEKGLMGSKHLANRLKEENIDLYAMLNFEMIGVPMVEKDHSLYLTGYELSNLAEVSNRYAQKKLVGFLPKAKEFNLFRQSDNAPFHDVFNVPSQTYSAFDFTNFGEYHKVGDEASKMDFLYMAKMVNEMIPVLTGIMNAPTKDITYTK